MQRDTRYLMFTRSSKMSRATLSRAILVVLLAVYISGLPFSGNDEHTDVMKFGLGNQLHRIGRKLLSGGRTFDGICKHVVKYRTICVKYLHFKVCRTRAVKVNYHCKFSK